MRIIQALRAGHAPREGVRFLSLGLEAIVKRMENAFEAARCNQPQILALVADYGDGKSHLLRLLAELAAAHRFAWAYIVHDKDQLVGLHKPAWFFRRILWELQWTYPAVQLHRFANFMDGNPSYRVDRQMRTELSAHLSQLATDLANQGFQGLVLCLDELENCQTLHGRQLPIFVDVLKKVLSLPASPVMCLLAFTTPSISDYDFVLRLNPPPLTEQMTNALAERIWQIHARAFDWQPTLSAEEVARGAWQQTVLTSGRWRAFVQNVVRELEIAHQQTLRYESLPIVGRLPTTMIPTPILPPTPPFSKRSLLMPAKPPSLQVGDIVEVVAGPLRGWPARIERLNDEQAEVVLKGRTPIRTWLPIKSLKRIR